MTSDDQIRSACREVSERIPWYVNGTISEDERQRVDAHLKHCANCRNELAQDRLVPAGESERPPMRRQGLLMASIVVMAVAISVLAVNQWMQFRARTSAPKYHTVTIPMTRAQGEVIRAVFSPTITLVEVQSILDEAGLTIVSGPTEAGVYSLAANSRRSVSSSLGILRGNAQVRFAESIQSAAGSEDVP
jgi:uncharacterized membrane protein YidH (DUF202 family)